MPPLFPYFKRKQGYMGKHKGTRLKRRHRGKYPLFSTLITTLFCSPAAIPGTGQKNDPKTLLAVMDTAHADLVVLPSAVLTQEERPFQPPFLASAHKSPCSGVLLPEGPFSAAGRSAQIFFASASRSLMEGFACCSSRRPLFRTPSIIP